MSSSAENKKRKLPKKSEDVIQKKKKVHFSNDNTENVTPKKVEIRFFFISQKRLFNISVGFRYIIIIS
jgi:hypothetical protein